MKKKSSKPVAKTSVKQTNIAGQRFVPPAYGISFVDQQRNSNDEVVQGVFESLAEESVSANPVHSAQQFPIQKKENKSGLPDNLKSGIENLSGYSMDDVKVHYNSDKPAQLQALAYTQGTNIHIASGQEKHLPHEAWHVAQQMQGRVKSTIQAKGLAINDDMQLEKEADEMGAKASRFALQRTESIAAQPWFQAKTDKSHRTNPATQLLKIKVSAPENVQMPVIQLKKTAFQVFNPVIKNLGEIINGSLGQILIDLSKLPKYDTENAEQTDCFASAWKGEANKEMEDNPEREMIENLIQSNWYGVGNALKNSRIESDKKKHLTIAPSAGENIMLYTAFEKALFFRAEREDSQASEKGFLKFDGAKHGKSGTASSMPGVNAEKVKERADKYLFVSKSRKEVVDYVRIAQGGKREVLNIIASRNDVSLMQYDVDSGGYKTYEPLTGIVKDTMTDEALRNLNTWLFQPVTKNEANAILAKFLK